VYHRLRKLCPDQSNLTYEVFDMLIDEDEGKVVTQAKKKSLKRMFRPDANNEISMLSFLQSCDLLYKKLRFFRASVGNASVIDKALEGMLNGIFFFILALVVLSIMRINPWPLLVSISTLLVSISFAVGSSASKYIEVCLIMLSLF
jgi:small-conductance mechanosensitive channel